MSRAKPYPSDPSMRESRVADSPALPVTGPEPAPPGIPGPNSPRAREEGLGVKPAVLEENLVALDELAAAADPEESGEAEAERQKREARNARRREQRAAKKAAAAKKAPAKKAAAAKKAAKK